jgi:uncharacterized protein with HEPN domain
VTRRESLRLGDIREAIATIDEKTGDAVLYNLVVIGEAANACRRRRRRWNRLIDADPEGT